MSKVTFPGVPPGRDISDEQARKAALLVREWYEAGDNSIETDAIVTVTRWALHALGVRAVAERTQAAPPWLLREVRRQIEAAPSWAYRPEARNWLNALLASPPVAPEPPRQTADETLAGFDAIAAQVPQAAPERAALVEIHNWLVCWPIATAEDMAQSFQHMEEVAGRALGYVPEGVSDAEWFGEAQAEAAPTSFKE